MARLRGSEKGKPVERRGRKVTGLTNEEFYDSGTARQGIALHIGAFAGARLFAMP